MFIFIVGDLNHRYYVPYSLFLLNIKRQDLIQFLCRELNETIPNN